MIDAPDIRVVADDLTGALDSASALARHGLRMRVSWRAVPQGPGAFDAGTREGPADEAERRHRAIAGWLMGGDIAFKKIDSLMRGHWAREVASLARACPGSRLMVAPAFPFQGRHTRDGRQWQGRDHALGGDIARSLQDAGVERERILVRDAESDADLDRIVDDALDAQSETLWVGTGGLAAALARRFGAPPAPPRHRLGTPLLGLIGSRHPVTLDQIGRIEAERPDVRVVLDGERVGEAQVLRRLASGGSCLVTVAYDGEPAAAAAAIAHRFEVLLLEAPRPGSLFAAGGETLRAIADALGADAFEVEGELEPGLPVAALRGGRWDGLGVVSKSGAFGGPRLLLDIMRAAEDHGR